MKQIIKEYFSTIIIVILSIIIFAQTCSSDKDDVVKVGNKKYEIIKQKTDTIFINKYQTKYVLGKNISKSVIDTLYIDKSIDSNDIIKRFNQKVVYNDTLRLNDNIGTITTSDTIGHNKLIGRTWSANIEQKIINNTIYLKEKPKNQVYVGFNTNISNSLLMVGPEVLFKTKKDNIYGMKVSLDNNLNRYIGFNIHWKIKLKKIEWKKKRN